MMTFKEFESELADKVSEFKEEYAKGMRDEPENFPDEFNRADWWEQFVMHIENVM